ncbi:nuclease-related domain-containing protein [Shewanella sp. HL-SH2]|uniref:nuclease-related domain-containing protein n=1 Tax=Shewanella sp. HL-SH2 TaxID=3436238 RepID=UPI003EC0DD89
MLDRKQNYFEKLFSQFKASQNEEFAYQQVLEVYLYRKPTKKSLSIVNREEYFWHSTFIDGFPPNLFESDDFVLALARYFAHDLTSNLKFISMVLAQSPTTVITAIRRSEIVLKKEHVKWHEINQLSSQYPNILEGLIETCHQFQQAHEDRKGLIEKYSSPFKDITLFEFLSFSAVYFFKYQIEQAISFDGGVISVNSKLRALTELIHWKLRHSADSDFHLNDNKIGKSLKKYHVPLVFPSNEDSAVAESLLNTFSQLMQVQVELDEFLSQSVHPFCFDDSLHFSVKSGRLIFERFDKGIINNWDRNGNRQQLLKGYWFNIAMEEFIASGMASVQMGSAENHDSNQFAYVKAIATKLELQKLYGFEEFVKLDNGFNVNLFQALLSLELMIAFYLKENIEAFYYEHAQVGDWQQAAGMVAIKGLSTGQNRFPITWSLWKEKVNNIVGWTVSRDFPKGSIKAAEAILEFWCLDMKKLSNELHQSQFEKIQPLYEKPVFKIGSHCVQLPLLMFTQYSSVSAVNNLRRFANLRSSLKDETTRIENQLGDAFEGRGFNVIRNYTANTPNGIEAGEIDLICVIDNIIFIIEVKSTYYRTTKSEVFQHRDRTLRKAGIQVRKKVEAIKDDLHLNKELRKILGLTIEIPKIKGLIADTSLEFDHDYFAGFMKVSIEELLIALADNAHFLCNQEKEITSSMASGKEVDFSSEHFSLYPSGFNGKEFLRVIEESVVWEKAELIFQP